MVNYYEILGVNESALANEIKTAYKAMALKYHPDLHAGDKNMEELFKQINEAYQTLSNPYKKSKYDLMRRYQRKNADQVYTPTFERRRPPSRNVRYDPPISNFKATAYAFLFAFTIALIMKTGMYILDEYRAQEKAEYLAARRVIYEGGKLAREEGNLESSLNILSGLGRFSMEEVDMREFKDDLLMKIKNKGDQCAEEGDYECAIANYDLLKDYSLSNTITHMKKIAIAYRGMGNVAKALEVYQAMHLYGYRTSSFYLEMGELYEEGMENYERALNYYKIGAEMASSEYEVTIGSAYPIVINASLIPEQHYTIYMKVALAHLELAQYQEAIEAVSWTKEIWSDSLLNYEIEAKAYKGLNDRVEMNRSLSFARRIDPAFQLD